MNKPDTRFSFKEFAFHFRRNWETYSETAHLWGDLIGDLWDGIKTIVGASWQLVGLILLWVLWPVLVLVVYPFAYLCFPKGRANIKYANDRARRHQQLLIEEKAREEKERADAIAWLEKHKDGVIDNSNED